MSDKLGCLERKRKRQCFYYLLPVTPLCFSVTQKTASFIGDDDEMVACGSDDWGVYVWALEGARACVCPFFWAFLRGQHYLFNLNMIASVHSIRSSPCTFWTTFTFRTTFFRTTLTFRTTPLGLVFFFGQTSQQGTTQE